MYAVVGIVKIDRSRDDEAQKLLEEFVMPTVTSQDGFASATWSRSVDGDTGHSVLLFDTEEHARATAARMAEGPPPGAPATFVSATVCEVVAQA